MVLEGTNGFLRRVVSVEVRGNELPLDVVRSEKLFNQFQAFIVENLNFGLQASRLKVFVDRSHCSQQIVCGSGFDRFSKDGVAILIICDHDVLHSSA